MNETPVVCLAFPAWDGDYQKSTVSLMKELARRRPVLYVDYAYTWKDFLKSIFKKSHACWQRLIGLRDPLRKVDLAGGAAIFVLSLPPVLPTNFLKNARLFDFLNSFNSWFLERRIRWAMRRLGIANPLVVNAFNPVFGIHLAGRLGEKRLVYYCYDEISAATWANRHGARCEQIFLKKADLVVVSSQGLFERKRGQHERVFVVKNGVDFELFSDGKASGLRNFSSFANLKQPTSGLRNLESFANLKQPTSGLRNLESFVNLKNLTIGYLGSMDERLDFDLLETLAERHPTWQFLFVGRVRELPGVARLRALPNAQFVGNQLVEQLPEWVRQFDVCLIPFVKNEFTAGIYPLKINEYLAAGKPVVATRFADLSDFESIIGMADSPDEFDFLIEKMLAEDSPAEQARRVAFASENSWEARAEEFERVCFEGI